MQWLIPILVIAYATASLPQPMHASFIERASAKSRTGQRATTHVNMERMMAKFSGSICMTTMSEHEVDNCQDLAHTLFVTIYNLINTETDSICGQSEFYMDDVFAYPCTYDDAESSEFEDDYSPSPKPAWMLVGSPEPVNPVVAIGGPLVKVDKTGPLSNSTAADLKKKWMDKYAQKFTHKTITKDFGFLDAAVDPDSPVLQDDGSVWQMFPVVADSYVRRKDPKTRHGNEESMQLNPGQDGMILIKFDKFNKGRQIKSAEIQMKVLAASQGWSFPKGTNFEIHLLLKKFDEDTANAWHGVKNAQDSSKDENWQILTVTPPSKKEQRAKTKLQKKKEREEAKKLMAYKKKATSVVAFNDRLYEPWQWFNMDVTDDVKAICEGTTPNYGWVIKAEEGDNTFASVDFCSKESDKNCAARLIVNYGDPVKGVYLEESSEVVSA